MSADNYTLTSEERARWRERSGPVLSRRPAEELAAALGGEPELLSHLRNLRAGREAGLRYFFGDRERRERLAEALEISGEVLGQWLATSRVPGTERERPPAGTAVSTATMGTASTAPTVWEEGAQVAIQRHLAAAARRLGEDADLVPALEEVLMLEAGILCFQGWPPNGPLVSGSRLIEMALPQADAERRRDLQRGLRKLLPRYPALGEEARLIRSESQPEPWWRFSDAELPALLVGRYLATVPDDQLRNRAASNRAWALAAFSATQHGDDARQWIMPLLAEEDPQCRVERALVVCAALDGARLGAWTPELVAAYRLCVDILCWLCPLETWPSENRRVVSPWELSMETWRQAVLGLARAALRLPASGGPDWSREADDVALAAARTALALPTQLDEADARVVRGLCLPWQTAAKGAFDADFFKQFFTFQGRLPALLNEPFRERWMQAAGLPALLRLQAAERTTLLVEPDAVRPAGYLMNRPGLVRVWYGAWLALSESAEPMALARLWVEAVQRLLHHGEAQADALRALLADAPERLRQLGVWDAARGILHEALLRPDALNLRDEWEELGGADDGQESQGTLPLNDILWRAQQMHLHEQRVEVLRFAGLSTERWAIIIAKIATGPQLPWLLFAEAGAPHAELVRWCVDKLRRQNSFPSPLVRGTTGVMLFVERNGVKVPDPGAALAHGNWQKAFDQAERALKWFLRNGDATAFQRLAESCYLEEPRFDPKLADLPLNLVIRLSGSLWGYAVVTASGRKALLEWVEAGRRLPLVYYPMIPEPQLLPLDTIYLWEKVLSDTALAPRAILALQMWSQAREADGAALELTHQFALLRVAAEAGADIGAALMQRLGLCASASPLDAGLFAAGLTLLALHHPASADAVLDAAFEPALLAALCIDGSVDFWRLILRRCGVDAVLAVIVALDRPDLGNGLFSALQEFAPDRIGSLQRWPGFRRAALFLASSGAFLPDDAFWSVAWTSAAEMPPLEQLCRLPDGVWLRSLLDHSVGWPPRERRPVLQRLAGYAHDPAVRRACLAALLAFPPEAP